MHNQSGNPSHNRKDGSSEQIAPKEIFAISGVDFAQLKEFLQRKFNVKLDGYRDEYILRRVSYHFRKSRAKDLNDYLSQLTDNELLIHDLLDVLTVNVSYFFRDNDSFELLRTTLMPELLNRFPSVRVWSMGCSMGAEIYSVALILHSMGALNKADLLATDNDVGALKRALKGEFHQQDLKTLPEQYKGFFTRIEKEGERAGFQISDQMKHSVKFEKHDLTTCTPVMKKNIFRKYHLLICRNVMIYFSHEIKEKLYEAFYNWLEPGGILFIGANEMIIGPARNKFEKINSQFYRKPFKVL